MSDFDFDLAEKFASEDARIQKLNDSIFESYDCLAEDELRCLESECEVAFTEMIWIIQVNKTDVLVWDYIHDIDYPKVVFPHDIQLLLRPRDVFLATLGMRDGRWHVLFLSPRYHVDKNDGDADECDWCRAESQTCH